MLQKLSIKNFAIIEDVSLEFCQGFNVLVGETGAGKTIILKALQFVLGNKAQKEDIRNNSSSMSVKATFVDVNDTITNKLRDFDIECDGVLIVSRSYDVDGKSSCKINGETVTVGMLKQIADLLYDIYGQHDNVELLNSKNHLVLLDSFDEANLNPVKEEISKLLVQLKDINSKINQIGGVGEERERTLDLLRYQIDEISNASVKIGEDEELDNQISTLSNAEKITSSLNQALQSIASSNLEPALTNLSSISNYSQSLEQIYERFKSVIIEINDIQTTLSEMLNSANFTSVDLDNLVARQELIKKLKKKYGPKIEDVLNFLNSAQQQYDNILNCEKVLEQLSLQKNVILSNLHTESMKLHELRKNIASNLEQKVQLELSDLKMQNTIFKVNFKQLPSVIDCNYTKDGLDEVEFLFSANKGESEKKLTKAISGGEMSRFMLALKTVLRHKNDVATLIFDEIDSGVSGEIGFKVGCKLDSLANYTQIICITHLPQVTALADRFIYVYKEVENDITVSHVKYLDDEQIISYLSTLLGGYDSQTSKMHAKELLEKSRKQKTTE